MIRQTASIKISGNNLMIVETTRANRSRFKIRCRSAVASRAVENEDAKKVDFIGIAKKVGFN
jgi:hypothetical protein